MPDKKLNLGSTGETVRANIKRLRGGMQFKELAERLARVGRPIPTLGLRRIEAGERRVDVDDLTALAVVFGVSPLTILLPVDGSQFTKSKITGVEQSEVAHNAQWLWGMAEEPLTVHPHNPELVQREIALFQNRSRPSIDPRHGVFHAARQTELRSGDDAPNFGDYGNSKGLVHGDGDS